MDDLPEENLESESKGPPRPDIPPPTLAQKPKEPESPLDKIHHSTPPPPPASEPAVKVRIRTGDEANPEDSQASGLAPFNARVTAMVIDWVIMVGVVTGLYFLLPGFAHRLAWLAGLGYIVTRDSLPFLGGQSVGKKAMKIRAVTLDGKPLTGKWEPSLIRSGVLLIPFFPLVELFILLTREDKPERGRRLGDEWAKTKVVIERTPAEPVEEA